MQLDTKATQTNIAVTTKVLDALRNGSSDALREVYLQWHSPLCMFLTRLMGSSSDAEDITQDVFVKLWNNREKIEPEKGISTYLYLLARHTAFHHFDKQRVRGKYRASVQLDDTKEESPYHLVVEKETLLLKEVALERMSPQRQLVYRMAVEQGLKAEEIAQKLGVSRETVYNQLSSAKKDLKDLIALFISIFVA